MLQTSWNQVVELWKRQRHPHLVTTLLRLIVLGAPEGHPDFVRAHLQRTSVEYQTLLEMLLVLPDDPKVHFHLKFLTPLFSTMK